MEETTFIELQSITKPELFEVEDVSVLDEFNDGSHSTSNALLIHANSPESNQLDEFISNNCQEPEYEAVENCNELENNLSPEMVTNPSEVRSKSSENDGKKLSRKKTQNKNKSMKFTKSTKNQKEATPKKPKCEYPRLCSGCGHAYKTKQSFWNHKQRCAMLPENRRRIVWDENGIPIEQDDRGEIISRNEYICAHCDRPYRKKYNLQEHLKNTCRGKPCSKGRLQCWEENCAQAFYKYVDLVQHVTLQHGKDLQIEKLQFANYSAFNSWKTKESNSKFMYARKITGSKRFSNTKYHYFVCQFNHRNEKKNNKRKTDRRKSVNLVVPNYNCPSRIMVKECENQIQVTYISSHNHELNLSNVKYQPLEKETRTYIKTLLNLGVSAKKIKQHLQDGVGNPEIDSFLATKQQFLTLNRIKRMESKLKSKNRTRNRENGQSSLREHDMDIAFSVDDLDSSASTSCQTKTASNINKEDDDVIKSIEMNLRLLKSYMHKSSVKEKLSDRISKIIQDLCDECENVDSGEKPARKSQGQGNRKRKTEKSAAASNSIPVSVPTQITVSASTPTQIIMHQMQPAQPQVQQLQPIILEHHQSLQSHIILQQPLTIVDQNRIVTNVTANIITAEKTFTPVIYENVDLLKPMYQPYDVNLLALKSLDPYIPESERQLLGRIDTQFVVGNLYDAVINNFLTVLCRSLSNVFFVSTGTIDYIQLNQKVPDVWQCYDWRNIDTVFIPCMSSKNYWFLIIFTLKHSEVKQVELQIFDSLSTFDVTPSNIQMQYKKYETYINTWFNVINSILGISTFNLSFPAHTRHNDPSNSAVLVCWYVFQYINKRSFSDNMDIDAFRKYIYNTIINNSTQC